MSLLPYILGSYSSPSRILDQHFGLPLGEDDLMCPIMHPDNFSNCMMRNPLSHLRPWRTEQVQGDVGSTSTSRNKNKFQVNLDVQQFRPEEITVKATGDNTITVQGKHEEKEDEHGLISRHFVRRYVLPKYCDYNKVESKLSSDGVLSITVPIFQTDEKKKEYKIIPVIKTGQPATVEQKQKQDKVEEKK